jgi:hypothetical protein
MRPSIFDADRAAATVFATIPLSSDHGSAEARRLVSRMQSRLERLERVSGGVGDAYGAVRVKLADYASRSAPSGRGDVPTMVAQVGPDVLARLRADEEFVAAVIDKAHVQSIYLGALDQAEETLDLLSALSNPR